MGRFENQIGSDGGDYFIQMKGVGILPDFFEWVLGGSDEGFQFWLMKEHGERKSDLDDEHLMKREEEYSTYLWKQHAHLAERRD